MESFCLQNATWKLEVTVKLMMSYGVPEPRNLYNTLYQNKSYSVTSNSLATNSMRNE